MDDQARQQMTHHFQLSLQCNVLPVTGFIRHTAHYQYTYLCMYVRNEEYFIRTQYMSHLPPLSGCLKPNSFLMLWDIDFRFGESRLYTKSVDAGVKPTATSKDRLVTSNTLDQRTQCRRKGGVGASTPLQVCLQNVQSPF